MRAPLGVLLAPILPLLLSPHAWLGRFTSLSWKVKLVVRVVVVIVVVVVVGFLDGLQRFCHLLLGMGIRVGWIVRPDSLIMASAIYQTKPIATI